MEACGPSRRELARNLQGGSPGLAFEHHTGVGGPASLPSSAAAAGLGSPSFNVLNKDLVRRTKGGMAALGLAPLWHFAEGAKGEAGLADRTSQAHGVRELIQQPATNGRQAWLRGRTAGSSFFPVWRL